MRRARLKFKGSYHHVMNKGINSEFTLGTVYQFYHDFKEVK
jgi:hypothetical protein